MRDDRRQRRMREIETQAYALFGEVGFEGASMLAVAKRAKASNETLYRWYGDKAGLFASMVRANAKTVRDRLGVASVAGGCPMEVLETVGAALLEMLLGERAIALNRAAASDPSGALGQLLTEEGRAAVLPEIEQVLAAAVASGALGVTEDGEIGPLFLTLLVGDQQIRRAIGALAAPSSNEIITQTQRALARLQVLCPPTAARVL